MLYLFFEKQDEVYDEKHKEMWTRPTFTTDHHHEEQRCFKTFHNMSKSHSPL